MIWSPATSLTSASPTRPSSCLSHPVLLLIFEFISMLMQALGFCHFLCLECSSPRYLHDFGPLFLNLCSNFYYQRGFSWPPQDDGTPHPDAVSHDLITIWHHLTDFIPSPFPPIHPSRMYPFDTLFAFLSTDVSLSIVHLPTCMLYIFYPM